MLRRALASGDEIIDACGRPGSGSATRRTGSTPRPSSGHGAWLPPRVAPFSGSSARRATAGRTRPSTSAGRRAGAARSSGRAAIRLAPRST
jgi:hypothetical protein